LFVCDAHVVLQVPTLNEEFGSEAAGSKHLLAYKSYASATQRLTIMVCVVVRMQVPTLDEEFDSEAAVYLQQCIS
jgi:hypothetical protein